jgi:signal transduction histidine kinase/CheY-like chemotaxis protein
VRLQPLLQHGRKGFPLIVVALGLAALLLFAAVEWVHGRSASGEQRVLALNRIQTKIAIAHLWVEEFVTGDVVDLNEIQQRLDESITLLDKIERQTTEGRQLLNGDEIALASVRLSRARLALARFADISRQRIDGAGRAEDVGIGSTIDARFDAVFAEMLADLRELENILQFALDRDKARSEFLVRTIVIAWLLIVALAAGGSWHRDRRWLDVESALLDSEARLLQAQKMDAVGRLAGGIAHDINNHLAAITMQCEVVKLKAAAGDPIVARMDSITAIGAKSADLIQRLLAFSRRQPVQPIVFNVKRIVEGMEKMLTRLIGEDIQLRVQCADDVWNVMMDPSQLEQVLLNLIINARDAMPAGGEIFVSIKNQLHNPRPDSSVTISRGEYVALTVSDQGTGIPADIVDKIYEPFFTTKDISSSSGLGLATVHGIVTQNRGQISVDSDEGRGTSFEILIPRSAQSEAQNIDSATVFVPQARQSTKILLVEDNEELRVSTSEILAELGYTVVQAGDGENALQLFEAIGPGIQLLITDVVMPGIGGKELADRIRKRRPEIPIIFISGYTDDVILNHGVAAGEVDFLAKPFSATELAIAIQGVLGRPG